MRSKLQALRSFGSRIVSMEACPSALDDQAFPGHQFHDLILAYIEYRPYGGPFGSCHDHIVIDIVVGGTDAMGIAKYKTIAIPDQPPHRKTAVEKRNGLSKQPTRSSLSGRCLIGRTRK